jgi:hypothetical protein
MNNDVIFTENDYYNEGDNNNRKNKRNKAVVIIKKGRKLNLPHKTGGKIEFFY